MLKKGRWAPFEYTSPKDWQPDLQGLASTRGTCIIVLSISVLLYICRVPSSDWDGHPCSLSYNSPTTPSKEGVQSHRIILNNVRSKGAWETNAVLPETESKTHRGKVTAQGQHRWSTAESGLESRSFDNGFYAISLNSCHHSTSAWETLGAEVKSTWSPINPHEAMTPNGLIPGVQSPDPRSNNIWWDEPSLCIYVLRRLNINLPPGAIKNKNS